MLEILHVTLNIVFFRFYHFLQNCVDFIYVASLVLYMCSQAYDPLYTISISCLCNIFLLVLFSHFLYSITYVVNDYINYKDDFAIKFNDPDKYSFYEYRPIQYFGKLVVYPLIVIYIIFVSVIWHSMFVNILTIYEIALIVLFYSILSISESLSKKGSVKRRTFFLLQLYSKYMTFAILLLRFLDLPLSLQEIINISVCASPYTIYRSYQDILTEYFLERQAKRGFNKIDVYTAMGFFITISLITLTMAMSNPLLVMVHLVVSAPFGILVIIVPSLILGKNDKTIYDLYKRSGIKLLFVFLLLLLVLWL